MLTATALRTRTCGQRLWSIDANLSYPVWRYVMGPSMDGFCLVEDRQGRQVKMPEHHLYDTLRAARAASAYLVSRTCAQIRVAHKILAGGDLLASESYWLAAVRLADFYGIERVREVCDAFDLEKFLSGGYGL